MKVRYSEGPAAVLLKGVGRVERGKSAEVPAAVGKRLLEQGWESASSKSSSRSKSTTGKGRTKTNSSATEQQTKEG
jgi:hypothetical protein